MSTLKTLAEEAQQQANEATEKIINAIVEHMKNHKQILLLQDGTTFDYDDDGYIVFYDKDKIEVGNDWAYNYAPVHFFWEANSHCGAYAVERDGVDILVRYINENCEDLCLGLNDLYFLPIEDLANLAIAIEEGTEYETK